MCPFRAHSVKHDRTPFVAIARNKFVQLTNKRLQHKITDLSRALTYGQKYVRSETVASVTKNEKTQPAEYAETTSK